MNICVCDWILLILHDNAVLPDEAEVDGIVNDVRIWVAQKLGWLPPGDRRLERSLRGRGGRRKILDSIVRRKVMRGVKPSGLVSVENCHLTTVWVEHLREAKLFTKSQFEEHLEECVVQMIRPVERRIQLSVLVECRRRMSDGFKKIQGDLQWREPRVLAVRALAGLACLSRDAVRKALTGARKDQEDVGNHVSELVFPRAAGTARVYVDLERLDSFLDTR